MKKVYSTFQNNLYVAVRLLALLTYKIVRPSNFGYVNSRPFDENIFFTYFGSFGNTISHWNSNFNLQPHIRYIFQHVSSYNLLIIHFKDFSQFDKKERRSYSKSLRLKKARPKARCLDQKASGLKWVQILTKRCRPKGILHPSIDFTQQYRGANASPVVDN